MTERIDHAAEAREALRGSGDGRNFATDASNAAIAHAVLALVEQQRIANLITLSQALDGNGWQAAEPLDAIYGYNNAEPFDEFAGLHVRPEIREALGLRE
ncbi:hypothetical protein ACF07D_04815 [Leucobacter sp. NPDC015123]|uniref:hypothetical protein n=1 Tax=Leucobacter sp. NPDC015123 TaxID=3364129 RepID=UPI0036F4A2C9